MLRTAPAGALTGFATPISLTRCAEPLHLKLAPAKLISPRFFSMAARKRSAGSRDNPNTVLVVFLVFFVLLSIALGVTTYYGYAGQKKLEEDALNARKEAKAARNAEDYYKFQALTARAAQGPLTKNENVDEPNDFAVLMEGFEDGSKFKDEKTRPAIEELVKTMKKTLGWNATKKSFEVTWAELYTKQDRELKSVQASLQLAMDQQKKAREDLSGLEAKNEAYWKEMKNDFEKKNAQVLEAAKARTQAMDESFKKNDELFKETEKLKGDLDKLSRAKTRTDNENKATIAKLEERNTLLKKQYEELANATAKANADLQAGDFAGKWAGTLMRGGAVTLEINADGRVIWRVPGIAEEVSGVSRLEKSGEKFVLSIQNQPVNVYLSSDRRSLRLAGAGLEATLNRK
jgi:hypothetical protein